MKEILYNLALINTLNYCKEHKINCSGTRLYKEPKGYNYTLRKETTGRPVVIITFYKSAVPSYFVPNN